MIRKHDVVITGNSARSDNRLALLGFQVFCAIVLFLANLYFTVTGYYVYQFISMFPHLSGERSGNYFFANPFLVFLICGLLSLIGGVAFILFRKLKWAIAIMLLGGLVNIVFYMG